VMRSSSLKNRKLERKQEDDANAASIPDVGSDQPASTEEISSEEVQPTKSSLQEVLESTTGLGSNEHAVAQEHPLASSPITAKNPPYRKKKYNLIPTLNG